MFHGTEKDKLLDIVIKKDMVQKKIVELNRNKSQGPDEIYPRLLKELSSVITEPLAKAVSKFVGTVSVPSDESRCLNVVTEGDRLDRPTRALARAPPGIRLRHRTPSRA